LSAQHSDFESNFLRVENMRISALLAIGVWLTLSIATSLNAQEAKVASKIIESDDIEELVLVSQGELPIILSAPH